MNEKKKTIILGLVFLVLLILSYVENFFFLGVFRDILHNQSAAVMMLFLHNLLVVILIFSGMALYVKLVILDFFRKEKYGGVVIAQPKSFALIYSFIMVFIGILLGGKFIYGTTNLEALSFILLIGTPIGIIEGYGIYLTIKRTLIGEMNLKSFVGICGIFFAAAVLEVGFMRTLLNI